MLLPSMLLALAGPGHVEAKGGAIVYVAPDGRETALTRGPNDRDPILSPDGSVVAYVHDEGVTAPAAHYSFGDEPPSALMLVQVAGGRPRTLIGPAPSEDLHKRLQGLHGPVFSPDGKAVFVSAVAWVTSDAVHRVDTASGAERYVIDGSVEGVIARGRYKGWLIVSRHKYFHSKEGGSYEATDVVSPDGKRHFEIARNDDGSAEPAWRKRNGAD